MTWARASDRGLASVRAWRRAVVWTRAYSQEAYNLPEDMLPTVRRLHCGETCCVQGLIDAMLAAKLSAKLSLLPSHQVAIAGRPNVGKSTLFNRLVGGRAALVRNTPGSHVTRDYQRAVGGLGDLRFQILDTSGIEPGGPPKREASDAARGPPRAPGPAAQREIQIRAAALTRQALSQADAALLLLDARQGLVPGDAEAAAWLRRALPRERVVLVLNKAESRAGGGEGWVEAVSAEAARLGLGEPVAVSAETGEGLADLYAALSPILDPVARRQSALCQVLRAQGLVGEEKEEDDAAWGAGEWSGEEEDAGTEGDPRRRNPPSKATSSPNAPPRPRRLPLPSPLKIAVAGVPNVGKSTLVNALVGSERVLTGPEPGLTRDAVRQRVRAACGTRLELIDTAGWVRGTQLDAFAGPGENAAILRDALEDGRAALRFAHAVVLVVDAHRWDWDRG